MAEKRKSDPLVDVYRTTHKGNRFDANGGEVLNPTPMQPPLGYKAQLSLAEQIRQQVRQLAHATDMDPETEEEADDFDIEDDPMIHSPWENDFVPSLKETRARIRELEQQEKLFADAEAAQAKAVTIPDPRQKPGTESPAG